MDLDAGINAVLERVKKTGSLDVQDERFLKFFNIYSDINSLKERMLESGYKQVTNTYFENKEKFIDISSLLKIQNLYEFMESAYMLIFSRACEKKVIDDIVKRLTSGEISKEEYLETLEFSEEAKLKDIKLVGYSIFNVGSFDKFMHKEFVRIAYIRLLKREADAFGLKDFTIKLKIGELTRDEVIKKIVFSNEAKGKILPKIIYIDSKDKKERKLLNKKPFNEHELEVISQDYDEIERLEKYYTRSKMEIVSLNKKTDSLKAFLNMLLGRIEQMEYLSNNKNKKEKLES